MTSTCGVTTVIYPRAVMGKRRVPRLAVRLTRRAHGHDARVPSVVDTARRITLDPSGPSVGRWLRARRADLLLAAFPDLADLDVIDLGGRPATWLDLPIRPRSVTLVNVEDTPDAGPADSASWITAVRADVCALPARLMQRHWDLAFSNSVIEHVGGHARRTDFAATASRIADRLWIQTPYRYFPLEPHWLFPGMQFLPDRARATIAARWPLAWSRPDGREAVGQVLDIELLSVTALRYYLPDATILRERVLGLPKSLIAVRGSATAPRRTR